MNFGKWNEAIHIHSDQQKRLISAQKAECTPLNIDREKQTGVFSGRRGLYNVMLNQCNCGDFIRRHLPCKHIYRLAIELGLVNLQAKADITIIKKLPHPDSFKLEESVDKIEKLSTEEQLELKNILFEILFHKKTSVGVKENTNISNIINQEILYKFEDPKELLGTFSRNELNNRLSPLNIVGFKKNMSLSKLIQFCIENIPDKINDIFSDALSVRLNPLFEKSKRKLYTYLRRKYDDETYFDGENIVEIPAGAKPIGSISIGQSAFESAIKYKFPDDDVTTLLNKYNKNRCT